MDSRQLHYIRSVVDNGSFTHAAEALEMTQPSLSLSIRKLEKELDVELISRGRAGVRTTEAGDYLYSVAVKLQTLLAEADQRIRDIAHGRAGTISVCSAPEFNWTLMPEVIHRLQEVAPTVKVFLSDPSPSETLARVLDGSVDVGLMPSTDPSAFAHRYQDELVVHTAAVFPFMLGLPERLHHLPDPISLMDLADETWVMPPHNAEFSGLREVLSKMWAKNPAIAPAHIQEVSTLQTALPLISGGVGVGLLPDVARALTGDTMEYREIVEQLPSLQAVMIYRKGTTLSPAANQLVDLILEVGNESMFTQADPQVVTTMHRAKMG